MESLSCAAPGDARCLPGRLSEVSTERDGQVPVWQMAAKAAGVQERVSGLQAR